MGPVGGPPSPPIAETQPHACLFLSSHFMPGICTTVAGRRGAQLSLVTEIHSSACRGPVASDDKRERWLDRDRALTAAAAA